MGTHKSVLFVIVTMLALGLLLCAQETAKEVKHVPIKPTSAASGQEMYKTYCAVCMASMEKAKVPRPRPRRSRPPISRRCPKRMATSIRHCGWLL